MQDKVVYQRLDQSNHRCLIGSGVFDNAVDPKQLTRFMESDGHELVFATMVNEVIGFASGTVLLHPDKAPSLFVNEVGVEGEYRRKGIARALCQMLFDIARDEFTCEGIWLATETDNVAARALYHSLDARETLDIVVYDWDGAMDA